MILIKKIKKYLLFILLLVFFLSCGNQESKQYEEVKEKALIYLREGYNEDFIIKDIRYIKASKVYEMMVVPKDDEDSEFYVKTGGANYGNHFVDSYSNIKRAREATVFYQKEASSIFRDVKIRLRGGYSAIEGENLPNDYNFNDAIKNMPSKLYVHMRIYIFEDVFDDEVKKKKFLEDVFNLVTYIKKQKIKDILIHIECYDEEFFKDKDIDHILKISDYFSRGTGEFDTVEYWYKQRYALLIEQREFPKINTVEDVSKEYYKVYEKNEVYKK